MNDTMKDGTNAEPTTATAPKEVLDAALMATLLRKPFTVEAKRFVEYLHGITDGFERDVGARDRTQRKGDLENWKRAIGAFASDLLFHHLNEEAQGYCYHSSRRNGFGGTLMTSTYFDRLIRAWSALGLIDVTGSFDVKDEFDGETIRTQSGQLKRRISRARRVRATSYMLDAAERHGLKAESIGSHFDEQQKPGELVLVRASGKDKSNLLNPKGDPRKREDSRQKLREINGFLAGHTFNLGYSPELCRIFNNGDLEGFDYNAGGRLYCRDGRNWQTMKKDTERPLITIDGGATAEVDVHASQLSILYALCGERLDPSRDAYALTSLDRDTVKAAVTIALGLGKLPTRWPKDFAEKYAERHKGTLPNMGKVISDVVKAHPPMAHLGSEGLGWARLQYEESEALLGAILTLQRDSDVPSLPLHDGLIVKVEHQAIAMDALRGAYMERFGIPVAVRMVGVATAGR